MTTPASHTVLITGAAGFIGSHLAGEFARTGTRVVGVDNFDPFYARRVKDANLAALRDAPGFEFVEADITDAHAMTALFTRVRPQGVVHLAAKAGVRPSIADPVGYSHTNVTGTSVILAAAHAVGCRRLLVASSSSVYGNSREAPFAETQDVSAPISPYAATKRACELIGHAHHTLTGMPTGMLRFFTVYGPRQRPDLAVAKFLRAVSSGEPVTLFGDGAMSRDYTFIDDIIAGILAAYSAIDRHGFRIWNLGGNHPVSLGDMVGIIERTVGRRAVIERAPMQPGDVLRTWADLSRARAELGYEPRMAFEEGVRRQWDWWRARASG